MSASRRKEARKDGFRCFDSVRFLSTSLFTAEVPDIFDNKHRSQSRCVSFLERSQLPSMLRRLSGSLITLTVSDDDAPFPKTRE
mmetsp:Transcript_16353/g.24215  ORF Transcript_16353/g.24215 Transcript_16353/m.24215 type:complete len:84 (-) Transcript_16353:165-416(-)